MSSPQSFEQAIEASHRALDEITRGNPEPFFGLYSRSEDATLANPYGPPARGFDEIEAAGRRAAANYHDGKDLREKPYSLFRVKVDGKPVRLAK